MKCMKDNLCLKFSYNDVAIECIWCQFILDLWGKLRQMVFKLHKIFNNGDLLVIEQWTTHIVVL